MGTVPQKLPGYLERRRGLIYLMIMIELLKVIERFWAWNYIYIYEYNIFDIL